MLPKIINPPSSSLFDDNHLQVSRSRFLCGTLHIEGMRVRLGWWCRNEASGKAPLELGRDLHIFQLFADEIQATVDGVPSSACRLDVCGFDGVVTVTRRWAKFAVSRVAAARDFPTSSSASSCVFVFSTSPRVSEKERREGRVWETTPRPEANLSLYPFVSFSLSLPVFFSLFPSLPLPHRFIETQIFSHLCLLLSFFILCYFIILLFKLKCLLQFFNFDAGWEIGNGLALNIDAGWLYGTEFEIFVDARKKREHKCRTCKKLFRSHQALGGHQRVHKATNNCSGEKIEDCEDKIQFNKLSKIEYNCKLAKLECTDNSEEQEMERATVTGFES